MIARMWKGHAKGDGVDCYFRHVTGHVFPDLRKLPGHLGAYVLKRQVGSETEFTIITVWESMGAVESFAGVDPAQAVVEPEARRVLSRYDNTVTHYEVAHCDPLLPSRIETGKAVGR